MPASDFRFPPGFDPRGDLLLDFEVVFDEDGKRQERVRLAGAIELPAEPLRAPDATRLIKRLALAHEDAMRSWLDGADDARRLVLRHSREAAAAWWKWEQLEEVREGRVGLVRCIQGLEAGEPKRPGPALRALVVIGDPRQPEGNKPINGEVAPLIAGISAALAESGVGSVTVAASIRWAKAAPGEFAPFETGEDLLEILRTGWDLVHIVSHGDLLAEDAHPMLEAGSLRLEEDPVGLRFEDLASALADGPTQLLTVQACHGGPRMAELLLRAVPHVLVFREAVPADFSSIFAAHFYRALLRDRLSVPAAVAAARQQSNPYLAWIPAHFSADLARPLLYDAAAHGREQYLHKVRDRYQRMGGLRLFDEDPRLQDQYVELTLEPAESAGEDRSSESWIEEWRQRGAGPLTLESLLALTPAQRVTGKWVLVGDPGSGKSTSLRALAHHFALGGRFVPILIRLPDWPRRSGEGKVPGLEAFEQHFEHSLVQAHLPSPGTKPHERIVLLDGLDECSDPAEHLQAFLDGIEAARVVVATRELQYADRIPQTFLRAHLKPLGEEQQLKLLTNLFEIDARSHPGDWKGRAPTTEAQKLLDSLRGQLQLAAKTPFILSLLALMRARDQGPSAKGSRFEVLKQALDVLILGEHRNRGEHSRLRYVEENRPSGKVRQALLDQLAGAYAARSRGLLRAVAFRSTLEHKDSFQGPELERWLPGSADDMSGASFLTYYTIPASGLLNLFQAPGPRNLPCDTYEFAHRVLREALTAEHLAETHTNLEALQGFVGKQLPAGHPELVNDWAEPLALLTGTLSKADQVAWVRFLQGHHPGLGLRVLANAELEPALVAEIVAGIENRDQRWSTYQGLFTTEDPRDALAVVELLLEVDSRATTVPDLARLDDLLRELAEREGLPPEILRTTARLRERLLDRACPRLPDDGTLRRLFMELPPGAAPGETHRDLWSYEIGPGSFEMGSPKDDEQRSTNEGPVSVTLTIPFRMARVTVTRAQYRVLDGIKYAPGDDELPATSLSWHEAIFFTRFLARVFLHLGEWSGLEPRLPYEAEWEFACREAGVKVTERSPNGWVAKFWRYHSGDSLKDLLRVAHFQMMELQPVGRLEPNDLGLYDMHGNTGEWCLDAYDYLYLSARAPDPPRSNRQPHDAERVRRGGSYPFGLDNCRAAFRSHRHPGDGRFDSGFRVVLAPRPPRR